MAARVSRAPAGPPGGGATPAPGGTRAVGTKLGTTLAGAGRKFASATSTRSGTPAHEAAGFILGALVWSWVVLPYVHDGVAGVKNTLRAKFVNEGADGRPL